MMSRPSRAPHHRFTRRSEITGLRLRRLIGPPLSSVLIRIQSEQVLPDVARFQVKLAGIAPAPHHFEWTRLDDRTLLLIIEGAAFPWVRVERSCTEVEVALDGEVLFRDAVEVEGFQSA